MSDLCVLRLAKRCADDEEGPREARFGYLCGSCYRRLEQVLAETPELYDALEVALRRVGSGFRIGGRGGEEPTFINGRVVSARDRLQGSILSWARVVAEERAMTFPRDTVNACSAFLVRHLDWVACQPWVDEMAREVDGRFRKGQSLAFPSDVRRITLRDPRGKTVRCVERVSCDVATREVQRCVGCLEATVWPGDELVKGEITCSECGTVIPSARWYRFGEKWLAEQKAEVA